MRKIDRFASPLRQSLPQICPRCKSQRLVQGPTEGKPYDELRCLNCGRHVRWIGRDIAFDKALAFVLPFGKYKGRRLGSVPEYYLRWLPKNASKRSVRERGRVILEVRPKLIRGRLLESRSRGEDDDPPRCCLAPAPRLGWLQRERGIRHPAGGPWKAMAEHLAVLTEKDRQAAWQAMLAARPDRDELITAMANVDPWDRRRPAWPMEGLPHGPTTGVRSSVACGIGAGSEDSRASQSHPGCATHHDSRGCGVMRELIALNSPLDTALELLSRDLWPIAVHAAGEKIRDRIATGKEPVGWGWGKERQTENGLRESYRPSQSSQTAAIAV